MTRFGSPASRRRTACAASPSPKRGFVEGRDFVVELRYGPTERLPDLARELVALKPDVIIAMGGPQTRALRAIANPLPVVGATLGPDPVGEGYPASLARPGGNYTGLTIPPPEQADSKRLQLLHEAIPAARRVAVLLRPIPVDESAVPAMRAGAQQLGIDLLVHYAAGPAHYPAAFAAMRAAGAQAAYIIDSSEFFRDAAMIAELALQAGLPSICGFPDTARDGCLLGFGQDTIEIRRRTADYVARIFQGTPPGDLPMASNYRPFCSPAPTR
jgi:putative ABC transport system substrate-binding protein